MDKKLTIAIPASVISDTPHLREKTSKIGFIGRAAAIFRVNEIVVYGDNPKTSQVDDLKLISTLLSYMETPQYLRKRLFKLEPQLQFAGILPPLRTPHHPLNNKAANLKVGEYREGLVLSGTRDGALVDIGVEKPVFMRETKTAINERITARVTEVGNQVNIEKVNQDEIPIYWGYRVSTQKTSFSAFVRKGGFDLTIGTSKFGSRFTIVTEKIATRWVRAKNVLLVFGSPARGLFEIARDEGINLNDTIDFVVNTIMYQGTETVRTEEAVLASLAILNTYFDR